MSSASLQLRTFACFVCFFIWSSMALAQQSYVRPLVHEPIDDNSRVILRGNTHPWARPQFEMGAAPSSLAMERMLLVLKRSPEQAAALSKLLDDQQDKSSPSYHKWLTPDQFGLQFGPADADLQAVSSWLQSEGFQVTRVTNGRTVIEFAGTAGQVRRAFHTPIQKYVVQGEAHWGNANDPEIPAALAPVVAGIHSLHNFRSKPAAILSDERLTFTRHAGSRPEITGSNGVHALTPSDYAVIYNIKPLYMAGTNGSGTTIAVVGRSNFNVADVQDFQSLFSVGGFGPEIIFDGPDPGNLGGLEEFEALIDSTWSSTIAPGARVKFVVSASTNTTDGIVLSELFIIDNNLGDVMTESFGGCESVNGSAAAAAFETLAQEAAAQGITYIVSAGDTGASGCDNLGENIAQGPVSVNLLAATPFTTAVGGTQFNENGKDASYWNKSNDPTTRASAKSYIPENVWNETCTSQCQPGAPPLASGGGGSSVFFSKPSWQTGIVGIPSDGKRDIPDISLTASRHDPYLLCAEGSCQSGSIFSAYGTSAAAPSFAGVMALIIQQQGSRQGLANYFLYRLAGAETLSQCNGSKTTALPAANCVFNDVTVGNNAVPGQIGYGAAGASYQSTVGYDLTTGLGSLNVANLASRWSSVRFSPTVTTLALTPPTFVHGAAVNVSVTVAPSGGSGTPTGDVSLVTNVPNSQQSEALLTLTGGTSSGMVHTLPGGNYQLRAHYAGDGTFAPGDSSSIPVTVSKEGSTTTFAAFAFDAAGNLVPMANQSYGLPAYLRADVAGTSNSGTASGAVTFTENGALVAGGTYSLNSEGTAHTAQGVFNIPAGAHSVLATYGGDSSFQGSVSAPVSFTITKAATSTAMTVVSDTVPEGTAAALTATVSTSSIGSAPRGQMTFFSGGTPIAHGSPVVVAGTDGTGNIQTGAKVAAQAVVGAGLLLPVGKKILKAQYSGDSNYTGSTSSEITVNVQPDFDFASPSPSIGVSSPGASGTIVLNITGHAGYAGTVNFSAASCAGLPRESTCSFNPASITGSGSTTLTVTTAAAHNAALTGSGGWTATFGVMFAGVFLVSGELMRRFRKLGSGAGCSETPLTLCHSEPSSTARNLLSAGRVTADSSRENAGFRNDTLLRIFKLHLYRKLLSLTSIALLMIIAGCGGGSSTGGSGGGSRDPGTPAGNSTVTVTATTSGFAISHSITFTLAVD
jgi:Pro-kumamolisin, activation domain/Bacterial Ig-like domain (group 3)